MIHNSTTVTMKSGPLKGKTATIYIADSPSPKFPYAVSVAIGDEELQPVVSSNKKKRMDLALKEMQALANHFSK